jgi:hypothetical protein
MAVYSRLAAEQAVCDAPRAHQHHSTPALVAGHPPTLARHGPVLSFAMWSIYGPGEREKMYRELCSHCSLTVCRSTRW